MSTGGAVWLLPRDTKSLPIQVNLDPRTRGLLVSALTGLSIGALIILYLYPIWNNRFLPLLDESAHLSHIFIWHHYSDPEARLTEYYRLNIDLVPYMVHYGLSHLLAFVMGVEKAHKVVLSLTMAGVPLAGLAWCARTKRSPWFALLLLPGGYGFMWGFGYHAFQVGVMISLFALVMLDALIDKPTWPRGIAAALLGVLTFFSHPVAVALFVITAFFLVLVHWPKRKVWGWVTLAGTPTFALCIFQVVRPKEVWLSTGDASLFSIVQYGFVRNITYAIEESINPVTGTEDAVAISAVGFVWLAMAWTVFRAQLRKYIANKEAGQETKFKLRPLLHRYRALAMAVLLLILFIVLPGHINRPVYIWIVAGRVLPFFFFFLFLSLPVEKLTRERWLMLPAAVAVLAVPLIVNSKYEDFNRRMEPLVEMVELTEGDGEVATLIFPPRTDPVVNKLYYRQTSSLVQLLRGGYNPMRWTHPNPFPFRHIKTLPQPHDLRPQLFNETAHGESFDYILVRNEPESVVGRNNPRWRVAADNPPWRLYARIGPPLSRTNRPTAELPPPVRPPARPAEQPTTAASD